MPFNRQDYRKNGMSPDARAQKQQWAWILYDKETGRYGQPFVSNEFAELAEEKHELRIITW